MGTPIREMPFSALGHDYRVQSTAACRLYGGGAIRYMPAAGAQDTYTGDYRPRPWVTTTYRTADSATCTSAGKLTYTCSRCKASYQTARAALRATPMYRGTVQPVRHRGYHHKGLRLFHRQTGLYREGHKTVREGKLRRQNAFGRERTIPLPTGTTKKVGTAQVTITGKGKYRGTRNPFL